MVLNGTSEATGGRIITTLLAPTYSLPPQQCPTIGDNGQCPIFVQAERFHDLLAGQPVLNDIRLSTAASNSARFPLIPPAGTIRDKDQRIVDRIVDGGYFEKIKPRNSDERSAAIDEFLACTGVSIREGFGEAYRLPGADFISLPRGTGIGSSKARDQASVGLALMRAF